MLSIEDKKAIKVATKKTFIVSGKTFNASCVYPGESYNYPLILLNYIDEGGYTQKSIGDNIKTANKGQRSAAHLSITIETKAGTTSQNLNKSTLAEQIALQLFTDIKTNWTGLNSGSVKAGELSKVRNLTSVYEALQITDIARYQFDVELRYNISW